MRTNIFLSSLVFITALAGGAAAEETERPTSLHRTGWGAGLVFEGLVSMAVGGVFLANSFRAGPPAPDGFGFGNLGCEVGKAADYITAIPLLATGGVKSLVGIPLVITGSSPKNDRSTPLIGVGPGSLSVTF